MIRLIFILCVHIALRASFFEEDDPMHYHHVNVITGHLNLTFQDALIKAPHPFQITRSYSSSGALERSPSDSDLFLKRLRDSEWMFQGGWSLLSHTNMLVIEDDIRNLPKELYMSEPGSSSLVLYSWYKSEGKTRYFRSTEKEKKASGDLSRRKKSSHTKIKVRHGVAKVCLADGGRRFYKNNGGGLESYWSLTLEILPSKHRIEYEYESKWPEDPQLTQIHLKNPTGTKTYATINLDRTQYEKNRTLGIQSSDGQNIYYQMLPEFKQRTYLDSAQTSKRPKEQFHYQAGRRGIGARIGAFDIGLQGQMGVTYHFPNDKKSEKKWAEKVKTHQRWDKVESIQFPHSETGQLEEFARFTYLKDCTEVRDYEGLLTRYIHDGERLTKIEYYNKNGVLHSQIEFEWKGNDLRHKTLLDGAGEKIFRKAFIYNNDGDILVEKWEDGFSRQFAYTKKHLIKTEKDACGLEHHYEYFVNTDLISKKFILYKGKILQREFFFYDEDHLLEKMIVDDGKSWNPSDLMQVTHRQIKTYIRHPETGLVTSETLSFEEGIPSITREFVYNKKRECISETVTYEDTKYTLYMEYDDFGHLTRNTTPLGRENCYEYNSQGNLSYAKEVGQRAKSYEYDQLGRPTKCDENGKISRSIYDQKGRLVQQMDHLGNAIVQKYDEFGNCIRTILPKALDENGEIYTPIIKASYDVNGNLISTTNPKEETTTTEYNLLRKPIYEKFADGTEVFHKYNNDGTLSETLESDGTITKYTYDPFQRMTSKCIFEADETLLSEENWVYSTFHLLSYTDPLGLTTRYFYDAQGRKIREEANGRTTFYAYDSMGNVERVTQGGITKVQIHNIEGEVVEVWEEDTLGKIENQMRFFYNDEGRKEKAIRTTANGDVEDFFYYDSEGHLCKHIDPYGATTTFVHTTVQNNLGQFVEQKTTTDPIGNRQIETFNANGKLVSIEKTDPQGQIVSLEESAYDRAGNLAKRVSVIYEENRPVREYTTEWEYNKRGLPISEVEEGEKTTLYQYNSRGWLKQKTLPSGISIYHTYDGLGRLKETRSLDVHYTYLYDKGPQPKEAIDHIHHLSWHRSYNLFGELISETSPNSTSTWEYDDLGRCTKHILPDESAIVSTYLGLHLHTVQKLTPLGEIQYTHTYTHFDENGHVAQEELIHNLGKVQTFHDLLERPQEQATPWHKVKVEYGPSGLITRTDNSLFQIKEYQYDPLNQLTLEGKTAYQFDSLGNPLDARVNRFNQITLTADCCIQYDKSGNLIRKEYDKYTETYEYDALNRLIIFEHRNKNRIQYQYDPFSRLYSKTTYTNDTSFFTFYEKWDRKIQFYLYDHDVEIGTFDAHNNIQELKVLGLGIRGDIGAAIAIELQSEIFAPLHDFNGNIIALVNAKGYLIEQCDMDAFGKAALKPSRNPWRFQSKRSEEHLIFFGLRFYDPAIGRWLTPDPAGSLDSPNLYLYVRNSPLNRLDLFGLFSEDDDEFFTRVVSYHFDASQPYIHFQSEYQGIQIDWLLFSNNIHKLGYSPEEFPSGNHLIEEAFSTMLAKDAYGIGLVTWQTGVGVGLKGVKSDGPILASEISGDAIKICIHTPSRGAVGDAKDTIKEKYLTETPEVIITRQLMIHMSEALGKISEDLLWMDMPHSRAGVVRIRAYEGMTQDQQKKLKKQLIYVGLAPAEPFPKEIAKEAVNIYSDFDNITGDFGRNFDCRQKKAGEDIYDIQFVKNITPIPQRTFYLTDHYLMAPTYSKARKDNIRTYGMKYGFYQNNR